MWSLDMFWGPGGLRWLEMAWASCAFTLSSRHQVLFAHTSLVPWSKDSNSKMRYCHPSTSISYHSVYTNPYRWMDAHSRTSGKTNANNPYFDLMEQIEKGEKNNCASYHSYEIPKPDLVHFLRFSSASSRFAIRCVLRYEVATFLKRVGVWPAIFWWLQRVKTIGNPFFPLLNLQMSVGLLRILLVHHRRTTSPLIPMEQPTEIRIDWVHQLRHLWVLQMLSASLDHFLHTLTSCLKPKTCDERFLFALSMGLNGVFQIDIWKMKFD